MEHDRDKILILSSGDAEVEVEYIDMVEHEGDTYAMFLPLEDDDDELIILKMDNIDTEYDSFVPVTDRKILQIVYEKIREKYKDALDDLDEAAPDAE